MDHILRNVTESSVADDLESLLNLELKLAFAKEFFFNHWTTISIAYSYDNDYRVLQYILSNVPLFSNLLVIFYPFYLTRAGSYLPIKNTFCIKVDKNLDTRYGYKVEFRFNSSYSRLVQTDPTYPFDEYAKTSALDGLQITTPLNIIVYSDKQSTLRKINASHYYIWGLKKALLNNLKQFIQTQVNLKIVPYGERSADRVNISIDCMREEEIFSNLYKTEELQ